MSSSPTRRRSSACPTAAPTSARSATSASRPRCCSGGAATARTAGCPSSCSCTSRPRRRPRRSACSTAALLAAGYRGDVNVIDFDGLRLHTPEFRYDLPAGGRRVIQRADGYLHTIVAGTEIREDGESTGATPGRLVRGAQPDRPDGLDPFGASGSGRSRRTSDRRTADVVRAERGSRTDRAALSVTTSRNAVDLVEEDRPGRLVHQDVVAARQRHEAAVRDQRRQVAGRRQRHPPLVAGVQHERRARHLRRQVGDVDLGERLEEAHRVVRRRRAPLQLVELLPLLAGAVGEELRREHLAERRVVAAPADPGHLEVEGRLAALLLGRRPQRAAAAVARRTGSGWVTRSGWRAANATATAAPCETPSSGKRSSPAASTTSSRSSTQSSNSKLSTSQSDIPQPRSS